MFRSRVVPVAAALAFGLQLPLSFADEADATAMPVRGEEVARLTTAPDVPPPITRKHATKVVVHLETREMIGQLADGVEYLFWTFGGVVPGHFIRVREGDLVEFHLHNHPDSRMPHNIDLHAVTGPGGGATSSFTAPGRTSVFSFKAINPGLYVYHCATAPVGMHIANGMYGLILVEPAAGLPKVDREYYVMQSEFYTKGAHGEAGYQPFSMAKALREDADYVVFNGAVGSMLGDNALPARPGERVRLFVGNGGPNLVSSFHVIGEVFDTVYVEGGDLINRNVQSTLIPAGGSAIVEMDMQVPGTNILVDHSIFRAFNKGALGMIRVAEDFSKLSADTVAQIYSGKTDEQVYLPEGGAVVDLNEAVRPLLVETRAERIAAGKRLYEQNCAACHQSAGQGIAGAFPPLAKSDWLNADQQRSIRAVLAGLSGAITVNGENFDGVMPALRLSDDDVAHVLSYVYNSWGNNGELVSPQAVGAVRAGL
ncbi:MAG: copper-containing nitrite reductase [bacterium]